MSYKGRTVGRLYDTGRLARPVHRTTLAQHSIQHAEARKTVNAMTKAFFEAYPHAHMIDVDYAGVEARVMAHEFAVNPKPYYSYLCSAMTLAAVYKAHRACEAVPTFDASYFAAHEWRNLSYATERGIVFG